MMARNQRCLIARYLGRYFGFPYVNCVDQRLAGCLSHTDADRVIDLLSPSGESLVVRDGAPARRFCDHFSSMLNQANQEG